MKTHELKCWPEHFAPVWSRVKTAELRRDDRPFQVGDTLLLREWEPEAQRYTGRSMQAQVTHIVRGGEWLMPGYCMLSLFVFDRLET